MENCKSTRAARPPLFWLLTGLVLLSACTTVPRQDPAPVVDRSAPVPEPRQLPEGQQVTISPLEREPVAPATPLASSAVVALLQNAEQQQRTGQYDSAAATLERALRIEPDNAHLWHELGKVRQGQQQWAQAEQMARKSLRLASGDRLLAAANWRLIAAARRGSGDLAGSREAERQAGSLR
ncbi:MAG: tetratricopeptide repeat protein [Gammaproteobacteria bacterium]